MTKSDLCVRMGTYSSFQRGYFSKMLLSTLIRRGYADYLLSDFASCNYGGNGDLLSLTRKKWQSVAQRKSRKIRVISGRYDMSSRFPIGGAIANGTDPVSPKFIFGSVNDIGPKSYWVTTFGSGRGEIFFNEAVSLEEVMKLNPKTIFVADRSAWYDKRLFVGGVVIDDDTVAKQYIIRASQGTGYISHKNAIFAERIIAAIEAEIP